MRCSKCAAEISVLRDFCPHCGTSTEAALRERERTLEEQPAPEDLQRNRKTVFAIGGAALILAAAMGSIHPFRFGHSSGHSDRRGPVTANAAELFEAYHTNAREADKRFGHREVVISGEFVRTVPDGYGSIDMRLKTAHPDTPLGIDLDGHSVDAATRLEPGQMVTLSCRRVAGTGEDPWLQDCVLQPPPEGAATAPAPPAAPTAPKAPAASEDQGEQ